MLTDKIVAVMTAEDRVHSKLSPSASHRWLTCPASVLMEQNVEEAPSVYAAEGTAAHSVAEQAVRRLLSHSSNTERPMADVEPIIELIEDFDLKLPIQKYLEAIRENYYEKPEAWQIEAPIALSDVIGYAPTWGSVDFMMVSGGVLHVYDYKHGQGVEVSAEHNPQMSLYAAGAIATWGPAKDVKDVWLHIIQPRIGNFSCWKTTSADLQKWINRTVRPAAQRISAILFTGQAADDDYHPSESACRFCKGRAKCRAFTQRASRDLGAPIELPLPSDPATIGRAYGAIPLLEKWIEDVERIAMNTLIDGGEVPGFKLVAGREGIRKWKNAEEAETAMRRMKLKLDTMFEKKLISPTTAEKLAKKGAIGPRQWSELQDLIARAEAKPAIVPESDKRPALVRDITDVFEQLEK